MNRKAFALRQERIRDLLFLALETKAGQSLAADPDLCAQLAKDPQPERLLSRFPIVPRDRYLFEREHFLNLDSTDTALQLFEYPQSPAPRIAILMDGFVETAKVMCFPEGWSADLEDFRAECLAGPVTMMRRMAASVFNRGAHFPALRRPLVVFTGLPFGDTGILTDAIREQLEAAFKVPVYEYFLGHRNEVLARECDAHAGLHVDGIQAVFETPGEPAELVITSLANTVFPVVRLASGLSATLTDAPCPCGFTGQRLLNVRAHSAQPTAPRVRAAMVGSGAPPPEPAE